ncbi:hypothetical protein HEP84_55680 [Streptomyces sp. RLB1-33]|uniref:hypothetical protein n=1 Tax=Streptomyces mirabilis TaxID=68239 RepID=UPI0032B4BDBC
MVRVPVAAQRQVEGGQRTADPGDGGPDRQDDLLEVGAGGAGEVDPYGQDPAGLPGGFAPLRGPAPGVGEGRLQLPGQGGLADAAHPVEDEHVVAGRFEVLDIEAGGAGAPQVLGERGRDQLPLRLPVRERLVSPHAAVVRTEQVPEIPARHIHPRKMITSRVNLCPP